MGRRICAFTGSRAEYGLLKPLLEEIRQEPALELKLLLAGTHLSREFGLTYRIVEEDGFTCDEKVEMILSSDTPVAVCKSMGLGMIGFSEALMRIKPDLVVILGDRFESMVAAISAYVCRIPIAHIQGGELTLGAIDDQFRHSITKMSMLHFVCAEEYRRRVIQLGEQPDRVFDFGALNVDAMKKIPVIPRAQLEKEIKFSLSPRSLLVTFHPVTLEDDTAKDQLPQLLEAISSFDNLKVIFTKTNADTEGRVINELIDEYVEANPQNTVAFTSMGQMHYINVLRYADAVAGNSSSGVIETPTFKVPTVNMGEREKGRIIADNVIDCEFDTESIRSALQTALSGQFKDSLKDMKSPYDKGETAKNIARVLKEYPLPRTTKKEFYDIKSC
ncbi:MAG TPA: UDP-N-acetylglucosamine 2-epimerase (hydrolyzing) [Nitrospirales bacterium]|nr:UDP-N-acetylglucosamine 2-epimerase (hydrolyzing) [Nitrospirales bacterium]HIC05030.1 UDP-N-acetylglucosamine 2-epimerase (hydrolyzing) [Nitrospirales bacterium]